MKYISNALFIIGFIIVCLGIFLVDADFILAIRMLLWGYIIMWMGWLMSELLEWLEERRHEQW